MAMQRDPLRLFEYGFRHHGDVVLYDTGRLPYVVIANPTDIQHVLLKNYKGYFKSAKHPVLERVLGKGVITTNGDIWRQQRRELAPAFQPRRMARLVEAMAETSRRVVDGWLSRQNPEIDVYEELSGLTRRVVGGALFGVSGDELGGELGEALDTAVARSNLRADRPWHLPLRYPTPRNRRFHRALDLIDRWVYDLIAERRAGGGGDDILAMLVAAENEDENASEDDEALRDQILNLFFAGFETSATALTWIIGLLAQHWNVATRIRNEVQEVVGDDTITFEHLSQLQYTAWSLDEAMRLYPPIWTNERIAHEDDELGGYHIPKGTMVAVSTWLLHRNPNAWEDPLRFDPLRFSPDKASARPKNAFAPFGLGPRTCVGNHFAAMQSKVMLASIVPRLRIDVPARGMRAQAGITLSPAGRMPGVLRPR